MASTTTGTTRGQQTTQTSAPTQGSGGVAATRYNRREVAVLNTAYPYDLTLFMPIPNHGFNDPQMLDHDITTAFNQISKRWSVKIDVAEDESTIALKAATKGEAYGAQSAILKLLSRKPGDENIWHPYVLIKLLSGNKDGRRFILVEKEDQAGRRPVAINAQLPSPVAVTADQDFKAAFINGFTRTMVNMQHVPNKMRMRVHFGSFLLSQWKKGQSQYSLSDLRSIAERAGPRGTARMYTHIGHCDTVTRIREQIPLRFKFSQPREIRIDDASDSTPTRSLVFMTKNLCIESVVDTVLDKLEFGHQGKQKTTYSLGPLTVFHRDTRRRAVTIMTSCPENRHDWSLEVENQMGAADGKAAVPFTEEALRQSVRFGDRTLAGDFPGISISKSFAENNKVENIIGKSSWSYLINCHYVVEISLYHQWEADTRQEPVSGASVCMYGCDWDYDMDYGDVSTGSREWSDPADQFLKVDWRSGDDTDPYDEFLGHIARIQGMLAQATSTKN